MKRKILSLILVLMLLPVASIFVACGDKGYDLGNLENDFAAIEKENDNIVYSDGKYVFTYVNHESLNAVFEYEYPYTQIYEYNNLYENLMAFTFEYIDECSNNKATDDTAFKDRIKAELDDFKYALNNVDTYVNMLAEIINITNSEDVLSTACLARLENLFASYEELFQSAITLNNSLSNLYFNHVLSGSNPNVANINIDNFDVLVVVNNFDARLKYQLSNLTQCFVEMYIDGGNLAEKIIDGDDALDLEAYEYLENVEKINQELSTESIQEKANANKQKFYNLSVQAYNIQTALNNDQSKFVHASNQIEYAGFDADEASAEDKLCYEIIDHRFELISEYNDVLDQILTIVGA